MNIYIALAKNENVYKYGCYSNQPVIYRLIDPAQNMSLESFDVQRMTFGWTAYDGNVPPQTTRITLANIDSYPGVNRDVAGPYDNVDMTGKIDIETGFSVGTTDRWLVDVGYDGAAANEYFIFPNPFRAVTVTVNNGDPFYIPETDIETLTTTITGGRHYTKRIDLTPYTRAGQPLEGLVDGDVVTVILKTQTVEALPTLIRLIQNFSMQTYLDINNEGPPEDKNILVKNFSIIDYKYSGIGNYAGDDARFFENTTGNSWTSMSRILRSTPLATTIFSQMNSVPTNL